MDRQTRDEARKANSDAIRQRKLAEAEERRLARLRERGSGGGSWTSSKTNNGGRLDRPATSLQCVLIYATRP
jgi:hypothetical protein